MQRLLASVRGISTAANWVSGFMLVTMVLLTMTDVILRGLGTGITGAYELMSFAGALTVGFAIAKTSVDGAHVNVDTLTQCLGNLPRKVVGIGAKVIGFMLFLLLAWSLFLKGNELCAGGEVTPTLRLPFFPIVYALSLCCLVESLVLLSNVLKGIASISDKTEAGHE